MDDQSLQIFVKNAVLVPDVAVVADEVDDTADEEGVANTVT